MWENTLTSVYHQAAAGVNIFVHNSRGASVSVVTPSENAKQGNLTNAVAEADAVVI